MRSVKMIVQLAVVFACMRAELVTAQNGQGQQWPGRWQRGANGSPFPPGVQPENIKGIGTLKAVSPNGILHVVGAAGDQWYVLVSPQAQVSYSAAAEQDWLQPGMFVRFKAKIDKRGKLESPLGSLAVVTPSAKSPPGVAPDAGPANAGADELFIDEKSAADKAKKRLEAAANTLPTYNVVGKLVSVRNGKFTVTASNASISGEIDGAAKVSVDLADVSLLQVGDKIEFDGQVNPMQKTYVWGRSVYISAAKKLDAESRLAAKRRPTATKSEDAKPEEKPGEKPAEEKKAAAETN